MRKSPKLNKRANTRLKTILLGLLDGAVGFALFWVLPPLLAVALNRTKGNGNNPEGEMFVPIGWLLLGALLLLLVLLCALNVHQIRARGLGRRVWWIFPALFLLGAVAAVFAYNAAYSFYDLLLFGV
ncbi:MAG TPA: hypothetical protein H9684_06500 [Firmicutes bacterium]|nr:hypothetical protein [Bacillota bacterium]